MYIQLPEVSQVCIRFQFLVHNSKITVYILSRETTVLIDFIQALLIGVLIEMLASINYLQCNSSSTKDYTLHVSRPRQQ